MLKNIASETEYETPSPIRTVIAMDFDNDGNQELFMNNIDYRSRGAPNTVHSVINSPNVSLNRLNNDQWYLLFLHKMILMLILLSVQITFTRKQDGFVLYPSRIFVVSPAIPSTVSRTCFVTVVTLNDWYERVMERSDLIILT